MDDSIFRAPPLWLSGWATLQVAGLVAALLARRASSGWTVWACQTSFFALLLAVGAAIIAAWMLAPAGYWLTSSGTLSLMLLTALYDPGDCDYDTAEPARQHLGSL
jgi:hypothetical protein